MGIKQKQHSTGFTIIELLIVIVVIGILAAITIVAYNGIQSRANTSSAQATANTVTKKAEAFNSVVGTYPVFPVDFTNAPATGNVPEAILTGSGIVLADVATKPVKTATVEYKVCENRTGVAIAYWNYSTSTRIISYLGTCTASQSQTSALAGGPF